MVRATKNLPATLIELAESVASVFIMLRKLKGYTSYESFAFDHDFPRAQYWRVENGKHNLTLVTLSKLLDIHGLTVPEFLRLVLIQHSEGNPYFKALKTKYKRSSKATDKESINLA